MVVKLRQCWIVHDVSRQACPPGMRESSYPRCENLCAPLWGITAPGGSGTRTSRLSLRERSEGVWELVLMGLSLAVLLSSASSIAMACETPDGRDPPGDGFPGGADILVTKRSIWRYG